MSSVKMPSSKLPVSARLLAAGRTNAARGAHPGPGPRTPAGKARSSRNARRHGFAAADYTVVRLDDLEAVARLQADLVAVYQTGVPLGRSQELFAIERIALAQHALLRAARLESGLFTTCLNEALDRTGNPIVPMTEDLVGDLEITRAQDRNYALAEGFRRIAREGHTWTLFLRYQAQTERLYRRAIEEFERLKSLRPELPRQDLPNEAIFDPQPDENPLPSALPKPTRSDRRPPHSRPGPGPYERTSPRGPGTGPPGSARLERSAPPASLPSASTFRGAPGSRARNRSPAAGRKSASPPAIRFCRAAGLPRHTRPAPVEASAAAGRSGADRVPRGAVRSIRSLPPPPRFRPPN